MKKLNIITTLSSKLVFSCLIFCTVLSSFLLKAQPVVTVTELLRTSINPIFTPTNPWKCYNASAGIPANWSYPSYNDATWSTTPSAAATCNSTQVNMLPNAQKIWMSASTNRVLFRKTLTTAGSLTDLSFSLIADDAVIVYLNGIVIASSTSFLLI